MKKIKLELKDKPIEPLKRTKSLIISPKKIVLFLFILFLIAVGVYFWKEICFLTNSPKLEINNPPTDITVTEDSLDIAGKTAASVYLTINNEEIFVDKTGGFQTSVQLSEGLNIIEIQAKNRFGKISQIIRRVLYKP